jgi:hypothetical protein
MIDVTPTKLSNLNFFISQDRDSSISLPLGDGGILQCHVRVGAPSLFGGKATSDLALTFFAPTDRKRPRIERELEKREG